MDPSRTSRVQQETHHSASRVTANRHSVTEVLGIKPAERGVFLSESIIIQRIFSYKIPATFFYYLFLPAEIVTCNCEISEVFIRVFIQNVCQKEEKMREEKEMDVWRRCTRRFDEPQSGEVCGFLQLLWLTGSCLPVVRCVHIEEREAASCG